MGQPFQSGSIQERKPAQRSRVKQRQLGRTDDANEFFATHFRDETDGQLGNLDSVKRRVRRCSGGEIDAKVASIDVRGHGDASLLSQPQLFR
jgi:hypothetical protein